MKAVKVLSALIAVVALSSLLAPAAQAGSPIYNFEVTTSTTQAGGHPDIFTVLQFGNRETQHIPAPTCNCQDPRDFSMHFPTGIIGDPHAVPKCSQQDFGNNLCPPETQVGLAEVGGGEEKPSVTEGGLGSIPVYNLVPSPTQAGLLGFSVPALGTPIYLVVEPRTGGDYGLDGSAKGITHFFPLSFVALELWGVPASPIHTPYRSRPGCDPFYGGCGGSPSTVSEEPFLDNPTTCGEALEMSAEVYSYDDETTHASILYPPTTGCDQLSFNPSLYAQPTTRSTDSASGLDVDLKVPQFASPTVPSPSEIKESVITLPPGFSINPNAADGKVACTEQEAKLGAYSSNAEAECPQDAKVGSLTIESSALPGPLPGYIFLGEPLPGEKYRLFLVADGYAVHVKLPGTATPDPLTGQLVVSFKNLPQTPFSDFDLHFFGSERSLLATPTQCGTYGVSTTFAPWDSVLPTQTSTQYFSLDSGPGGAPCPPPARPFSPTVRAGVAAKTGGAHAPFTIEFSRADGDQTYNTLGVHPPPGLLATLKGIPYCPEAGLAAVSSPSSSGVAELAAPSCPAASQIGISSTGAGAGDHPVYLPGKVYLAGPYKGAPLSLVVVTPAVSGPYDLGNVVVRVAVHIDPVTAQINAESDPLPQILQGIPLRLRTIQIALNRENFTLNPTDCEPFKVETLLTGDQGAQAMPSAPFQAGDCTDLSFKPKIAFKLSGATKRSGNPALTAIVTQGTAPYANYQRVQVTLPHSEFLEQNHIKTVCTRVQFAAKQCPAASVYGHAEAISPLLDQPLTGPVYLRSSSHQLPDLVAALHGPASQPIEIDLDGRIDSVHGGIRTTFEGIPDAAVTKFTLTLPKGKKSLLANSTDICKGVHKASAQLKAQNGSVLHLEPKLEPVCKGKKKAKGKTKATGRTGK
jgi:hypothetical protein